MTLHKILDYFEPSRILDIGANIGQFRTIAQQTFPNSYIFSIEASPDCEVHLARITDQYKITLLSKDNSEYSFYGRKGYPTATGNSIYKELTPFYSDDQLEVRKVMGSRLDDLFSLEDNFDLIKIDTQGSELDIIEGGKELCKKAKAILLEVSYTEYNLDAPLVVEVIEYMQNFGFIPSKVLDEQRNHGSHQEDILFLNSRYDI